MTIFEKRRSRLQRIAAREKVDAILVTSFTNVTYLTGFTGDDSYLLVTRDGVTLVSDPRYTTQLEEECPDVPLYIRDPGEKMLEATVATVNAAAVERLGFEDESLTVGTHTAIAEALEGVSLVGLSSAVESLRVIKDRTEIEAIRHAAQIAAKALGVVRAAWTDDATEEEIARELEYQARRFGGRSLSFPPIIAAGPRAALPHASPTAARVGEHPFTLVDWGVYAPLYASDLTRMVIHGSPTKKFRRVYDVVLEAQLAGIEAIRPGVTCEQVDAAARQVITKAGFGPKFGHGLGHGLGLEVHEGPRLGRNQEVELKAGMVVTVEPGVYLPGALGVRIEDDVLVTKTGYELLSDVPKSYEESCL